MAAKQALNSRTRSLLLLVLGLASLSGCLGAPTDDARTTPPVIDRNDAEDLPLLQVIEGVYDGEELTFRTLERPEVEALRDDESVGLSAAPLVVIDGPLVAFSTIGASRRAITNGAAQGTTPLWTGADVPTCGPVPATGNCAQNRLRNLRAVQLERVYAKIISLTPTGATTFVEIPTQPMAAAPDFGVSTDVPNGLWRFGEIGRSSPTGNGPLVNWAFTGVTPPGTNFTFSFLVEVHGMIVQPTRRGTLVSGQIDDPASNYPARSAGTSVSTSGIAISTDASHVAFVSSSAALTGASGNYLVRKNLVSGAISVVNPTTCTLITNPDLSYDGSVVVFQASGCDLTGEGSASSLPQIYAHDFNAGLTTLVTRSEQTGSYAAGGASLSPRVSDDGFSVVFQSASTNLSAGYPAGRASCPEVYRSDLAGGSLQHVSVLRESQFYDPTDGWVTSCSGAAPVGETPDISGDGNMIVFSSSQPLQTTDTLAGRDIYVYDYVASQSGAAILYRVSLTPAGGNLNVAALASPSISTDGAFVAFASTATNIAATTAGRRHIYRRSAVEGDNTAIELVTRRVNDLESAASTPGLPELSGSGRFVAFWSNATDLATDGTFAASGFQLYVCDMDAPVVALERCWVASTFQATAGAPFTTLGGSASSSTRIGLAYPSDLDPGYVAYQAIPNNWGTLIGGNQVFVSPVGDPRYQQAATRP